MNVIVGISNRHVHLTEEDYKLLFGDTPFEVRNELKQPGMFASTLTVSITGSKRTIDNVRVLGPCRSYTQVEVSRTDAFNLGVNPPVRNSGDLADAVEITITGPKGSITRNACIIATRHIHVNDEIRKEHNLVGIEKVSIRKKGEKGATLDDVYLKDNPASFFELHLDTDDANALLLNQEDELEIIL